MKQKIEELTRGLDKERNSNRSSLLPIGFDTKNISLVQNELQQSHLNKVKSMEEEIQTQKNNISVLQQQIAVLN